MSMHLEGPWLNSNSNRKAKNRKLTEREELELALYNKKRKKEGLPPVTSFAAEKVEKKSFRTSKIPDYKRGYSMREGAGDLLKAPSVKDTHIGAVSTKSVMDPMYWKGEDPKVIEQTIAKSKRIAIAYNKGGYQYVTDGTDPTTIGKKQ